MFSITFLKIVTIAARRVLAKQKHRVGTSLFRASKPEITRDAEPMKRVVVEGIPESTHEDCIEVFFENRRKSGGGPIEHIERDQEKGCVIITYESAEGGYKGYLS